MFSIVKVGVELLGHMFNLSGTCSGLFISKMEKSMHYVGLGGQILQGHKEDYL